MTTVSAQDGQRHTGIGAPQNRLREIAQSRAFSSHCPKRPSRTCSGTQSISWLWASRRSFSAVTRTNHERTARYIKG